MKESGVLWSLVLVSIAFGVAPYVSAGMEIGIQCADATRPYHLQSVKWYFESHEIFRYDTRESPSKKIFPYPGLNVDLEWSDDTRILLKNVVPENSGMYTCEVTAGKAPNFEVVQAKHRITVGGCRSVHITSFTVPYRVHSGSDVELRCVYDLEGQQLQSAHWYVNETVFFTFPSSGGPQELDVSLRGLPVDWQKSDVTSLFLKDVQPEHSGYYCCELTAKGQIVRAMSYMHVRKDVPESEKPTTTTRASASDSSNI